MAGIYNTTFAVGETWSPVFTWKNPDGSLINLTGFSGVMKLKDRNGNLLATPTLTFGGVAGTIQPLLSATITAALTPTLAEYDLFVTSSGGITTCLLKGTIDITPRIS